MDLSELRTLLGWCIVINYALLLTWFVLLMGARDWLIGVQARIFELEPERVRRDQFHLFGQLKLLILVFNIAPWVALVIVTGW